MCFKGFTCCSCIILQQFFFIALVVLLKISTVKVIVLAGRFTTVNLLLELGHSFSMNLFDLKFIQNTIQELFYFLPIGTRPCNSSITCQRNVMFLFIQVQDLVTLVLPVREIQLVEKMDNTTGNELGNNALLITTKGKVPVSLPVLVI